MFLKESKKDFLMTWIWSKEEEVVKEQLEGWGDYKKVSVARWEVLSNKHLQFEMSVRHPSGEVIRVIVYRHLKIRGETWDGDVNSGIMRI